jgi:MFS transporter, OFA family, oxalate/formate antiporter
MTTKDIAVKASVKNLGWLVTFAGTGILLALGLLYAWSVISKQIPAEWGWTELNKSMPYSVACLVFSLMMVPGGRLQDRFGPRIVVMIGGVLAGLGMVVTSLTTSPLGYIIGFGVLLGTGLGFAYSATTPAAVKWFPGSQTGMISGIVVAGFGLASAYVSPLSNTLIHKYGLQTSMLWMGVGMFVVVMILSQILRIPPAGYVPQGSSTSVSKSAVKKVDFTPSEVLKTWQFYVLWLMFAFGAGAGLMVISKLAVIVESQTGRNLGYLLVSFLALGNGGGRIIAGMFSDKFGRKITLGVAFVLQAVLILLLSQAKAENILGSTPVMIIISALIGACYGSNLSIFPSISKDFYGLKNFGINYGLLFTAWGLGGFSLSLLAGSVYDTTKSFTFAQFLSAALLIVAAALIIMIKAPQRKKR